MAESIEELKALRDKFISIHQCDQTMNKYFDCFQDVVMVTDVRTNVESFQTFSRIKLKDEFEKIVLNQLIDSVDNVLLIEKKTEFDFLLKELRKRKQGITTVN